MTTRAKDRLLTSLVLFLALAFGVGWGNIPVEWAGSQGYLQVTVTSSNILSASATTIATAVGGDIQIESLIVQTNATGIAGCTNVNLLTDNTIGKTGTIAAVAAATLGANVIQNSTAFAVTALGVLPFTLKSTKVIQNQATVAPCTGAGTITYGIRYTRVTGGASLN